MTGVAVTYTRVVDGTDEMGDQSDDWIVLSVVKIDREYYGYK